MSATRWMCVVACVGAIGALVLGCSSSGPEPTNDAVGIRTFKISEYVGDGHGGTKPLLFGAGPGDVAAAMGSYLGFGGTPRSATVVINQTQWYKLPASTVARPLVITVQPTADEDTDLYVLNGRPSHYPGADACLGYSDRTPSGSDGVRSGYAPDWVSISPGNTTAAPITSPSRRTRRIRLL
jgi:hypothetical protein